ncbi:hypothetical protein CATRI_07880 [Corynebacterium atrinae]|uniref:hypothetical protein n=1 Tax=Corynebacterium atrinae TaxID=1336740 RepID=UPI0025B5525E|nr:hypothetical protein [Corynebacterium atrinae]WJY63648.1 hypothetical protein CATRI_07880 [Corynebacterium atrinae]
MEFKEGVAAFDPVTLRIAAEQLPLVNLPAELDGELPHLLAGLSVVEVTPFAVTCTIDTGLMSWDASRVSFNGYRGGSYQGVLVQEGMVAEVGEVTLARAPMRLGEHQVWAWFAELPSETQEELDAWAIVAGVRGWMKTFSAKAHTTPIQVPAQQVDYEAFVKGMDRPTRQRITLDLDDRGARVEAETVIIRSAMRAPQQPVVLGENGPVLVWFSEENSTLPFAIVYTEADAWLPQA